MPRLGQHTDAVRKNGVGSSRPRKPALIRRSSISFSISSYSRTGDGVRFSYAEAMTDFRYYIPLAKAAEAAGYASMTIADSVAYPFESDSKYPYTPDGNR